MPRKIAVNTLNASTVDILNTIRANASQEYQNLVPEITKADEIPRVGEVVMGYPGLANQFLSALMNRIAAVRVKSATFNNAYAQFKKGYLEFGETVEEVFVNICKAREFSAEKAEARELKRSVPDVRTAMHIMNWRVQYPLTIQHRDLERAFLSADGVTDLIARLVGSLSTAAEYDEYLLFKYLIIKGVNAGAMYREPLSTPAPGQMVNFNAAATAFRSVSNTLPFMSNKYNAAGVTTNTNKDAQLIIMDAHFNAAFDVNVLASAFNMDKANFMGKLMLMDDFTTFDNERFDVIRANSDMIEEVTAEELNRMRDVKAIILDSEWFQVYDNLQQMSETQVASGLYWNYFLNVWKTVSYSPFSNAVVFMEGSAMSPGAIDITVDTVSTDDQGRHVITFTSEYDNLVFEQTEQLTQQGIAMHKYGALVLPATAWPNTVGVRARMGDALYTASPNTSDLLEAGASVTLTVAQD